MPIEFAHNMSEGLGDSADKLIRSGFDPGVLRPWLGRDGRSYITRMVRNERSGLIEPKVMVTNTPATLTRDAWIAFDNAIVSTLRERLRAAADIRAAGLTYNLPNGMAHSVLQYQTMGDITRATISMSPARRSEGDRPETDTANLPLPIIHKDFDFDAREILISQQGRIPIDTTTASLAARKVAEELEMLTVGTSGTFTYGGGTIYGYTNLPERFTKTDMTVPTGANGTTVVNDILTLRQGLIDDRHFGPYRMYVNSQWSQVLDNDFSTAKGDQTLRQRILSIQGIQSIETLDHLPTTKWHVLLVEMQQDTVRMVVGMEVQTVQWESMGGMMKHFKVMTLQVPQIRADTAGTSGVAHGRTA